MFGYRVGGPNEDLERDYRDNAFGMPKSVVVDPTFDWTSDRAPERPLNETVVYEVHVKGFSRLCPHIPEGIRGTYAGLGSSWAIDYFKDLGITAVELLPVHQFVDDKVLADRGMRNYWGYNSIGYFAPDSRYSSSGVTGGQVQEFKTMVKTCIAPASKSSWMLSITLVGFNKHFGTFSATRSSSLLPAARLSCGLL
jgi:isoamylase